MRNINRKELWNLPNMLSLYRLLSFPVVFYFILVKSQTVFIVLLGINLFTDFLDGYIARKFNLETQIGARLDSLADEGTYILGLTGIYIFKRIELEPYHAGLWIFAGIYLLSLVVSLLKFKMLPSLHLFSSKIGGYMQGFFFFVLFFYGLWPLLFYITVLWGIASFLEQIIIMLIIPELRPDLKGLFWILKSS